MEVRISDVEWGEVQFEESEPRAEGLHLGTVIRSLQNSAGLGYRGKGFEDMNLTAEIGVLWERVFSKAMASKYIVRPPQIKQDGIWLSLDGIGPDPDDEAPLVVEEMKATWSSTKSLPHENFYYMAQVKSYCHALDTPVAIMRIFYIMGNYRGSGPQYRIARYKFTAKELISNWSMIIQHRDSMVKRGEL